LDEFDLKLSQIEDSMRVRLAALAARPLKDNSVTAGL